MIQRRTEGEAVGDLHALFKLVYRLFAAGVYRFERRFVNRLPEKRHGEDVRYVVALYGVDYRFGRHIVQMDERPREKREPYIHCDKPENVIKRQERKLFQLAVVMLFYRAAGFYYTVAALYKEVKFACRVGADLYVRRRAGRHKKHGRAENFARRRSRGLFYIRREHGPYGKRPARRYDRRRTACVQRVQKVFAADTHIEQKRAESGAEDRPEKLYPQQTVFHVKPYHAVPFKVCKRAF